MEQEDAKFKRVVAGCPWWYWNEERTKVVRVVRDGSGKLWANWGDGNGSDILPSGPAIVDPLDGLKCTQRGVALELIRDELEALIPILMRLSAEYPPPDPAILKRVLAAHSCAMGAL